MVNVTGCARLTHCFDNQCNNLDVETAFAPPKKERIVQKRVPLSSALSAQYSLILFAFCLSVTKTA